MHVELQGESPAACWFTAIRSTRTNWSRHPTSACASRLERGIQADGFRAAREGRRPARHGGDAASRQGLTRVGVFSQYPRIHGSNPSNPARRLPTRGEFDEDAYLHLYPDIARASRPGRSHRAGGITLTTAAPRAASGRPGPTRSPGFRGTSRPTTRCSRQRRSLLRCRGVGPALCRVRRMVDWAPGRMEGDSTQRRADAPTSK